MLAGVRHRFDLLVSMSDHPTTGLDSPRAWLIVVAAFIGAFVTFGITYSFGVFLKPVALQFHVSHALMSALFPTITALSFFAAPFTGELADHYGPRPVVATGAVLIGAGLILTARVERFPFLFVTYGVGLGGALACTYIPSIAAVGQGSSCAVMSRWGIAISGIGCGTLVAAPLSAMLIECYGWRTALEIFGWSGAALLLLCAGLLARPPVLAEKRKIDIAAKLRTRAFAWQFICFLFAGIAVYVSLVFLPAYATLVPPG